MAETKKKLNLLGGISDLIIFILLVGGAGFFGYFVGINQKLAPVEIVPPGMLEEIKQAAGGGGTPVTAPDQLPPTPPPPVKENPGQPAPESSTKSASPEKPKMKPEEKQKEKPQKKKKGKTISSADDAAEKKPEGKYWLASSGSAYIGSSIVVAVNGHPVDSFFAPGKLVDVSDYVKNGSNQVTFEARTLPDQYNQHLGFKEFNLTLKLVSGPTMREDFAPGDVLITYARTAADTENAVCTMKFTGR